MLATPRKTDADRGFRGDVLAQIQGQNNRHAGMLSTPRASDMKAGGHGDTGRMGTVRHQLQEALPTPTEGMLGTPTKDQAVRGSTRRKIFGAINTPEDLKDRTPTPQEMIAYSEKMPPSDKWAYARQVAEILTAGGLIGPSETLPVTYGWMLGYRPGRFWLSCLKKGVCDGQESD